MDDDKQARRKVLRPGSELYARCAERAKTLLDARLRAAFDAADDKLFDLADKAATNAQQSEFFDGMREVRKKRSAAERAFGEEIRRGCEAWRDGAAQPPDTVGKRHTDAGPGAPEGAGMSLVEDRELEEELAISEMVAKGCKRLAEPLYALNQRLGALLRVPAPADEENPLGPAGMCRAFRRATRRFELETPSLILLYKLFEEHVIGDLEPVYAAINEDLIAGDILPRLRAELGPPTPAGAARPPPGPTEASPETATANGDRGWQSGLAATILELIAQRRASAGATAPPNDDRSLFRTTDLLNALHVLQAEPTETPRPGGGQAIKGIVLDQAAKMTDRETVSAAAGDEDTIDLVAMLFEFILQDRNLPESIQVLLSRLQIPYIKVALLDRRLFASKSHPARRLLDALAEAGVGWSRESDRGQRLYNKVSEVVEAVLHEFDDDVETFERLAADFDDFLTQTRRRAEVAEKRTTEATEGRERLQRARQCAAREVRTRLERSELPKLIEEILRKPWANVLVLTHLRSGEDSTEFRQGLKFVDDLIWTAQPKTTAGDVARLQSTLPHLAKQLRGGLAMVAYQDEDIAKVFKSLKQLYRSMIDRQYREHLTMPGLASKPRPPPVAKAVPVALPAAPGGGEGDVLDAAVDEKAPVASARVDAARLDWVKNLEVGTWFEFQDETGNKLRAKLSWKSPITSKFLLVDQKGIKVADKPVEELAQEIVRGDTVVMEAVPLFQRALGAIADRLQVEHEAPQEAGGDGDEDEDEPAKGAG